MGPRKAATQHLQVLYDLGTMGDLSDGQLLERFASREGEAAELAFAVLLEKHGPMVLRVCRSVLKDDHASQDAFQATFLVLVRKARGLWVKDSLGPWLHQVALRVASRARLEAARRRSVEGKAAGLASRAMVASAPTDLAEVIHREIDALPDPCRSAVVLCCLQGLSLDQAARRLGWPMGTVQSRLARGRQRLRDRLARRGLSPTASTAGMALATERAGQALAASLAESTTKAAMRVAAGQALAGAVPATVIVLVEGVLRTMQFPIVKATAAAVLLIGGMAAGAASLMPPRQDEAKPAALSRNAGKGSSADARTPDLAYVVGMPLPVEGQTIEVQTQGPGVDEIRMVLKAEGPNQYVVTKYTQDPHGKVQEEFSGTAVQVIGRYSRKGDRGIPIDLPGGGQKLKIRAEGPKERVMVLTIERRDDGTYSTLLHTQNKPGEATEVKMVSNDVQIAAMLRNAAWGAAMLRLEDETRANEPVQPAERTSPVTFKYLPLDQGQATQTYYATVLHLESKALEGWDFCGSLDMKLTSGEYEALRDGNIPPPAADNPTATYKVLVFKRPRDAGNK